MKKNIFCLIILGISICAFTVYNQYNKSTEDTVPPKITCEEKTITASVNITDEELISGIVATDNRDGDVSKSLVIENMSNFIDENTRIVTYCAIDKSMNVSRIERTLIYTDYEMPKFELSEPLSFVIGSKINFLGNISATSTLDGDLTKKIRYGLDVMVDNMTPGKYPIEFRVADSCGKISYLNTEVEVYDRTFAGIDVRLTDYILYLPKDSKFKAEDYYKGSNVEGELSIDSNVNTKVTGTYHVDYIVHGINASGKSRMIVVVY